MDSCAIVLVESLVDAAVGIGIIGLCWRLLKPLDWAAKYSGIGITKQGLFQALPIYGFLRRYFLVLLLAGCIVLLASIFVAVLAILNSSNFCAEDMGELPVFGVLLSFFSLHFAAIWRFEKATHRHDGPHPELVENVSRRIWGVAVFLLLAVVVSGFGDNCDCR